MIDLQDKKVLITGGAGFVGSHMCDALLRQGAKVLCIDDLSTGSLQNISHITSDRFSFSERNVCNDWRLRTAFKGFRPDYVMHYAAMVGVDRTSQDPYGVYEDFEAIKNIVRYSHRYGVKKILFSSSSEVYGEPLVVPTPETYPLSSEWAYGLVKIISERYLLDSVRIYNIPVVIVRFFNVYGPRQDIIGSSGFVVPMFIRKALSGTPMTVFGEGQQTRDFVYIDDNIRLTLAAFCNGGVDNKPMNIGSGNSITILDLARAIQRLIPSSTIEYKPLRNAGEVIKRGPDVGFMKTLLQDEPIVTLEDGLKRTIEYYKGK